MKLARFAASALLVVGLAACGGGVTSQVVPAKKVAFLLPDTTSARYESQHRPLFQAKLQSVCGDCTVIYRNANGDAAAQLQQAQYALGSGANVVVLDPVDAASASSIVAAAARRHVPVIDYDRLVLNTTGVRYYVGFDNTAIGTLQGKALLAAVKGSPPAVVMLNGDAADHDAATLKTAVHRAIDGKVSIAREFDTPASSSDGAQLEMTQALTALNNKLDGVYAANDDMASGALEALRAEGLNGKIPVSGTDGIKLAVEAVKSGDMAATASWNPYWQGGMGLSIGYGARTGKFDVTKEPDNHRNYNAKGILVTKDTVDDFIKNYIQTTPKVDWNDYWGNVAS